MSQDQEKPAERRAIQVLPGEIDNDYIWNPGPVIGRFLTRLRDDREILAVRCPRTSRVFLPPQAWSPAAPVAMDRYLTLQGQPTLSAGTVVDRAPWNLPEGLKPPYMLAAIRFPGADTDLIHLVVASRAELMALQPGAALQIRWKEPRSGTIRDIDFFTPATTGGAA
ncbi:MAG: hypothetical protein K1X75_13770 [Leptospirales bacterium]|nr:hypothetical protein [Leptospirales bacterium]